MSQGNAEQSLGGKLRSIDLDRAEAVALATILLRAQYAAPEVEGFGFDIGSLGFGGGVPGPSGLTRSDGLPRGGGGAEFKGSDEELQAIVGWLIER